MNETCARRDLAEACWRLYDRRLTFSAGGNVSVRVDDGVLITPSGRCKGALEPADMVKVAMDGAASGGRPSSELGFHLALYRANPDVNAVVHCHPLHCTALAVRGARVRCDLTPEGVLLLGEVPMVGYFAPGSQELADAVAANAGSAAMVLRKHGAVTQGRDLDEACDRMEELEFQAELQMLCGRARGLTRAEAAELAGGRRRRYSSRSGSAPSSATGTAWWT